MRIRGGLFFARFDCFVDLSAVQKGAHMSRFDEVVNEAIGEVVLSESPFRAETLAQHIAELVRARQNAERAEVTVAARYPEHKPAPVSGLQTQEIYTLHGRAVAFPHGTRRIVGVSATGHDRVPVRAGARRRPRSRAARRAGLLRRAGRGDPRQRARRHAQPARARHAAHRLPRGLPRGDRRRHAARDRRVEHVVRDLRADEALRRGRGGREGAPPAALRRGLRARDDRRRRAAPSASSTAPASSPRARRTSRRSTSTTSSPSAADCSPSCARRSPPERLRHTRRASPSGSTATTQTLRL